jgi:hypothetical protein
MKSECTSVEVDAPEVDTPPPADGPSGSSRLLGRIADAVRSAHRAGVPL